MLQGCKSEEVNSPGPFIVVGEAFRGISLEEAVLQGKPTTQREISIYLEMLLYSSYEKVISNPRERENLLAHARKKEKSFPFSV